MTKLVHGEEEAIKAQNTAEALFGGGGNLDLVPTTEFESEKIKDGMNILDLIVSTGLVPSKAEGRRLINQGGLSMNDEKIDTVDFIVTLENFKDGSLMLKKGKKTYHRVVLK